MHEAPIAQGILEAAVAAVRGRPGRILKIVVVAGAMTGVQREPLEMYLSALSAGTAVEGTVLELKRLPAALECTGCKATAAYDGAGEVPLLCERCGAANRLTGGLELYVESLEVEDDDDEQAHPAGEDS